MKAVGDKRGTFARVDIPVLDLIDRAVAERDRPGVRNLYLTLCQVATIEMAALDRVFEATRRLLMAKGSIGDSTLTKHMATLEQLGVVEVERRGATHGGGLPNRYVLVDPPAPPTAPIEPKTDRNEYPPVSVTGGVADTPPVTDTPAQPVQGVGGHSMTPLRARHDVVKKKKEEGERERAHADQGSDERELGGARTDAEHGVAAELDALLAERGQQLTARDRLAIRSALHSMPEGVDAVAAAARIRKHYGAGGKAEHRKIGSIAAVLVAELKQSSTRRDDQPRRAATARRRERYTPTSNASFPWKIHDPRPLDPPDRRLQAAWQRARDAIKQNASDRQGSEYVWRAYLEPLGLAGVYFTPVSEVDHADQAQVVIVLDAPADVVDHVAEHRHMRAMVAFLERELGEEGILVELARRAAAAVAAA